jgi:hypothetical protein
MRITPPDDPTGPGAAKELPDLTVDAKVHADQVLVEEPPQIIRRHHTRHHRLTACGLKCRIPSAGVFPFGGTVPCADTLYRYHVGTLPLRAFC